ncbi:helix-turn-helix domain-containing protein [Pseudonocardia sp. HH130630-07]|uniref:helix-turn-helix domain-containing protein n=1 Tax=Pseudonocardia sp. HH130630-07 TaxID=1690815 RepID=UPI0008153DD6|nr:helix-turn-helix transcriptional regulator [Pseudonocardia sp. HH130630-07]ANY05698.1 hypothetical protein AFB00_04575 [Pseudonocardia sp. HH130630-07]
MEDEPAPHPVRADRADRADRSPLRAARLGRGWSQSQAARELAGLAAGAADPAGAAPRAGSLKTQLSRWENGHATPAPEHRALLSRLYGVPAAELGLEPPPAPAAAGGADRLRAALARSSAVDAQAAELLHRQLRATAALDHRLGTAAAHAAVRAQVDQLGDLLGHCLDPAIGTRLADLLARAALLAGDQERDRDDPDLAWRSYTTAATAARRAGRDDLATAAEHRRWRLAAEIGVPGGPLAADLQHPPAAVVADLLHEAEGPSLRDRAEAALREARAATEAGRPERATEAAARAGSLALRGGSARVVARLRELPP